VAQILQTQEKRKRESAQHITNPPRNLRHQPNPHPFSLLYTHWHGGPIRHPREPGLHPRNSKPSLPSPALPFKTLEGNRRQNPTKTFPHSLPPTKPPPKFLPKCVAGVKSLIRVFCIIIIETYKVNVRMFPLSMYIKKSIIKYFLFHITPHHMHKKTKKLSLIN
jgi:hypothetical protein